MDVVSEKNYLMKTVKKYEQLVKKKLDDDSKFYLDNLKEVIEDISFQIEYLDILEKCGIMQIK